MRIFQPVVAEGFQWVLPVDEGDFDVFQSFDGSPRAAQWVPVKVKLLHSDEGKKLEKSDFPWLGSDALILGDRAMTTIGSQVGQDGELLRLDCDEASLWALNVCRVIDALDIDRSSVVRFGSGRIMTVREHVFHPEKLKEEILVFKIPQLPGSTYVTEAFLRSVEKAELRGLDFNLVWDDRGVPALT